MDGLINVLRENAQIKAAAKIMEACTFYVLLKNAICSALEINKTKLYQSGDSYCG